MEGFGLGFQSVMNPSAYLLVYLGCVSLPLMFIFGKLANKLTDYLVDKRGWNSSGGAIPFILVFMAIWLPICGVPVGMIIYTILTLK